jgi:hypothetical protein
LTKLIESYHLLATLAFMIVSVVVSVRMLLLARRTRRKPELLLGLGVLGTAVLGYGVLTAAALLRGITNPIAQTAGERTLQAAGQILHDAGVSMVILFVLTVFRPTERWAKAVAGALLALLWGGHVGWELSNGYRSSLPGNAFWWLRYAVIWVYPLWTMIESYRYYAMMRRRVAVGLAEPLVTNRFFLWGTGALGTALATWCSSLAFFVPPDAGWLPLIEIGTATFGVTTVTLYSLTFFPPASYKRWVTAAH